MTFGRITALLGVISAICVALIYLYPDLRWTLPVAAAEEARGIDDLFRLMLVVSTVIFIFVQGFLLYFVWLYRRRPEDPEDAVGLALHGDNRLEIAWTAAPALFLVVLTILSYNQFEKLRLDQPVPGAHIVDVEGFQFAWRFTHPETGIVESNVLTMEKGQTVTFNITGNDVTHAFWVPAFRLKQDATPGFTRSIHITPNMTHVEAGYTGDAANNIPEGFPLRCAELCGIGHSQMLAYVRVLEPAAYAAWETEALEAMANAGAGVTIYQENGCNGCHLLEEANAVGAVGPTHENLAETSASRIADPAYTGEAASVEDYIRESIRNPGVYLVEGYANSMPAFSPEAISDEELDALVELLLQQDE